MELTLQRCRFSVFFPLFLARSVMLIFSIFSYFIFLCLNFLSLFVFIFCETARTHRFSVIFAKVQWHPWPLLMLLVFVGNTSYNNNDHIQGAVQDFLQCPHTVQRTISNRYAQVAQVQSCVNHVTHPGLTRATRCVPCGIKEQLSY